jgi:exopolyphosphatase/guanosine-5'-triphosphate,3'-diphosphate pyrophosphatase
VSYAKACFPRGKINAEHYRNAYDRARLEAARIRAHYHGGLWEECVGSSGTLQAIEALLTLHGWSEGGINRKGLGKLEKKLLKFRKFDDIKLEGLSEQRRNVILPGVSIASAMFDVLGIEHMRTSKGALREGVIYDLMGRLTHEDVRERTVNALQQRYSVDTDTAELVERRASLFFSGTRKNWQLDKGDWELLHWVARTHEVGMAISHKHFNRHTAYLLRNADLPGFSQEEQEQLAVLALGQRGKIGEHIFADIGDGDTTRLCRLLAIIRLAVCFKHVEPLEEMPEFNIIAAEKTLTLEFPDGWLEQHPLTAQELEQERRALDRIGLKLALS